MKPITTDTYTFSDLIDRGCVYVDKTDRLLSLIGMGFSSTERTVTDWAEEQALK